ncbi:MAG TPA: glutaminase [Saprospirales bacterium]|nr:glutaminase [Saprospirales bacterium]
MDYSQIISEITSNVASLYGQGKVADYIPELGKVAPRQFGFCLHLNNGEVFVHGDSEVKFSIQSISKVFTLSLAFSLLGEDIWKRVGVEPSGTAFNSLMQLEYEKGIPRNPLINAGALVITDMLVSNFQDPKTEILQFLRQLSGTQNIQYNETIAASERKTGYRNFALGYFLKSFGNLQNDVEQVLDVYFHQCSVEMTCRELASAMQVFSHHGMEPFTGQRILSMSQTKRLNAVMQTCGFYDEAGEFTFAVGLPGKSGVGGGIAALLPGQYSLAVWSPELNKKGNSVLGMKALELFTTLTGRSVF